MVIRERGIQAHGGNDSQRPERTENEKGVAGMGTVTQGLKARNRDSHPSLGIVVHAAYATGYRQVSFHSHAGFLTPAYLCTFRSLKGLGNLRRRELFSGMFTQQPFSPPIPSWFW